MADDVLLDDPALAPIRADKPDLLGRRRRPGGGRVPHDEAAHGEVVDMVLGGIENGPADVDLDQAGAGIGRSELRPDRRPVLVHLGEPERRGPGRLQDVIERRRLGQPFAVEIDRAGVMRPSLGIEPIAVDEVGVGIEGAEERMGEGRLPDAVPDLDPVLDDLGALDLDLLARRGLIRDPFRVGLAAARRIDPLPVDARVDGDDVARLGQVGGPSGSSAEARRAFPDWCPCRRRPHGSRRPRRPGRKRRDRPQRKGFWS